MVFGRLGPLYFPCQQAWLREASICLTRAVLSLMSYVRNSNAPGSIALANLVPVPHLPQPKNQSLVMHQARQKNNSMDDLVTCTGEVGPVWIPTSGDLRTVSSSKLSNEKGRLTRDAYTTAPAMSKRSIRTNHSMPSRFRCKTKPYLRMPWAMKMIADNPKELYSKARYLRKVGPRNCGSSVETMQPHALIET